MFRFLTSVGHETTDPLFDVVAAEAFYRALPRDDLIAAQKKVCAVLGEHVPRAAFAVDRLRALLALDQRARSLVDMPRIAGCVLNRWNSSYGERCGFS